MSPLAMNGERCAAFLAVCCSLFVAAPCCEAQNLVPNHSFEEYDTCRVFNDVYYPDNGPLGWFSAAGTPDYYLSCLPSGTLDGVPLNRFAFQYPQDGENYVGMLTYYLDDAHEYFMVQLVQPLVVGQRYYASFYANAAWGGYPITPIAWIYSNGVGMVFTTQPRQWELNNPYPAPLNYAQVYSDPIITDTVGWTLVSGSFVADSAYQYVMLGNHFSNANTDTLHIIHQIATRCSYTLIDNVCVSPDSDGCPIAVGIGENGKEGVSLYPNPAQHWVVLDGLDPGTWLRVHDVLGRCAWQGRSFENRIQLDVGSWARGTYMLHVEGARKRQSFKFVLTE